MVSPAILLSSSPDTSPRHVFFLKSLAEVPQTLKICFERVCLEVCVNPELNLLHCLLHPVLVQECKQVSVLARVFANGATTCISAETPIIRVISVIHLCPTVFAFLRTLSSLRTSSVTRYCGGYSSNSMLVAKASDSTRTKVRCKVRPSTERQACRNSLVEPWLGLNVSMPSGHGPFFGVFGTLAPFFYK